MNETETARVAVVTGAVIVVAEVIRAGRFLNVLLGASIVIAPSLLTGATTPGKLNDVIARVVVLLLSLPRRRVRDRHTAWNRVIF